MSGNQRTYGEGFRERGLGTEEVEAIVVMVVPAFVLRVAAVGTAGGFLRFGGAGGADRRAVVPDDLKGGGEVE